VARDRGRIVGVSYPVTHLALTAEDADALRHLHASGEDVAVLARVRELAAGPAGQLTLQQTWEPIRRCLAGHHALGRGESVFGRRHHVISLLEAGEVAATAAALAEVSQAWLRERFEDRVLPPSPGLIQPDHSRDFDEVWESFGRLAGFFARAGRAGNWALYVTGNRFWRPPRQVTRPDGRTYVVRPAYRPQDYTVDPNAVRSMRENGNWPIEAELDERDGALYSWTEVERFLRGGRTWIRLTNSDSEYYIDVEIADDRIGRIECVDPLVAYWLARRADKYPVVLED
jgi:hypothetical protein